MPPDAIHSRLLMAAPTLVLCAVGGRQLWLANNELLSPWKGGGFGMFATIDSPGNRFIHCTGVTEEGERVLIRVGSRFRADIRQDICLKLKTYPRDRDLEDFVRALLSLDFVRLDVASNSVRSRFFDANPGSEAAFPSLPEWPTTVLVPRDVRVDGHAGAAVFRLGSATATVWRYSFDPTDGAVRACPILGPRTTDRQPDR